MSKPLIGVSSILILIIMLYININLSYAGSASEYVENKTGVVINKEMRGDLSRQQLVYTIRTPKIDDFDFVLAVDSSGSLGPQENYLEGSAVATAVPAFIEGIANNYSRTNKFNFNVSIVSWNDEIEFASSAADFRNKDPSKAKLFLINKSVNDINTFTDGFRNYYDCSDETTGTDISTAIKSSIEILDADVKPLVDFRKTKKFVILVTGKGEFEPCSPILMNLTQEKRYDIFTVGLDIAASSYLYSHLKDLTGNRDNHWKFIGASHDSIQDSLDGSLETALMDALDNATKSSVADNVKIVESLYCYYKPDMASFKIDGVSVDPASIQKKTNLDGTTTIILGIPDGIKPNSEKVVSFAANFEPGYLPVTITKNRNPITICSPGVDVLLPNIHFDWFNGESFEISLI
jgi:hypothetical protein